MAVASQCGGSERRTGPGPFDKEVFASSGQEEPAADPLEDHIDEPPPKRQRRQQAAATPVATVEAAGFPRTKSGQEEPAADPLEDHIDEPPPKRQRRQQAAATLVATVEAAGFQRTKSSLNLAPTEKVKDESDAVSSVYYYSARLTEVLDGACPPEHGEAVRAASPRLVAGPQVFAASQGHDSVTDTQTE